MQNKQALIGKARLIIEGLPALLKNTVTNKNRAAFIHGIKGHGGDYLFTRAGRFISQRGDKLPISNLLKNQLDSFITRQNRPIQWVAKEGKDRFKKSLYSSQGNIKRMLDRLSRRTMWTPDTVTTYTDHPITKAREWLRQHLMQLGDAQRAKKDPNYDPMAYALQKLRQFSKR